MRWHTLRELPSREPVMRLLIHKSADPAKYAGKIMRDFRRYGLGVPAIVIYPDGDGIALDAYSSSVFHRDTYTKKGFTVHLS